MLAANNWRWWSGSGPRCLELAASFGSHCTKACLSGQLSDFKRSAAGEKETRRTQSDALRGLATALPPRDGESGAGSVYDTVVVVHIVERGQLCAVMLA
jgi:hypothetical protein